MLKVDKWRPLPSNKGEMAINWTGEVLLRETAKNGLYMQGSKDIFLRPEDVAYIHTEYTAWLAAGNNPVPSGTIVAL